MYIKVLILSLMCLLSACSSLLPSEVKISDTTNSSFDDVRVRYDTIVIGESVFNDLVSQGFDPYNSQNVDVLTYTDIIGKFMPNDNITMDDLHPGVRSCIVSREKCLPFTMHYKNMKTKSIGNAAADIFGFVKERETRGWEFGALFILVDGVVVYKLYEGEPHHYEYKKKKRPLGPLQSVGEVLFRETI